MSDLPLFGLNLSSCKCKLTVVYIVVVFVNFRLKEICLYCRCLSKLSPNRILLLLIEVNFSLHPLPPSTLQLHGVGRMIDKFRASQMSNFRLQWIYHPSCLSFPCSYSNGSGKSLSSIGTLKVLTICTSDCFMLRTSDFMVLFSSV